MRPCCRCPRPRREHGRGRRPHRRDPPRVVRPGGRRPRPRRSATSTWRRSRCRTRSRPRSCDGRATASRTSPARGSSARAHNRAIDVIRRQRVGARAASARPSSPAPPGRAAGARRARRRAARPAVRLLPPGAGRGGARDADAADRRGPDRGGDRARVPDRARPRSPSGWCARSAACARPGSRSACRRAELLSERLDGVLGTIYLLFNEGYAATAGPDPIRGELCDEAIRLARLLVRLMPDEPEARGLLALMLAHRRAAGGALRRVADGAARRARPLPLRPREAARGAGAGGRGAAARARAVRRAGGDRGAPQLRADGGRRRTGAQIVELYDVLLDDARDTRWWR